MTDPTTDPLGWLREVRGTFATMLKYCGAQEAERYFRACEPEAAKAMSALPPRSVGLVADLQAECLAALDRRAPLGGHFASSPPQAEGAAVSYRDDGTRAEPPPDRNPDENRPAYPLEGKRLVLEDWLARWEELARTHPAHLLPVLYHAGETTQARREIREDVRFDQAVLTRLVEAADVMAARTEGKAGKRKPTPRKRT
jgi:hypothetical protein